MIRRMRFGFATLLAAVTATLCIGMATGASAAIEPAGVEAPSPNARKPTGELEQLAEIRVRGKSLARTITDAEDDFFKLYNQLNRNDDYEIVCGHMSVNGSLIMRRVCVPGFVADRAPAYMPPEFPNNYVPPIPGCSSVQGISIRYDGSVSQMSGDAGCSPPMARGYISAPSTAPVSTRKREAYAQNVVQVINSDPRLVAKVQKLTALYEEMEQVKGRLVKVRRADLMDTDNRKLRPR